MEGGVGEGEKGRGEKGGEMRELASRAHHPGIFPSAHQLSLHPFIQLVAPKALTLYLLRARL